MTNKECNHTWKEYVLDRMKHRECKKCGKIEYESKLPNWLTKKEGKK